MLESSDSIAAGIANQALLGKGFYSSLAAIAIRAALQRTESPHHMSKESNREQRRYERVKLSLNVNWGLTRQCETDARITSISQGGAFIQTKFTLLIDQIIFLRLMLREEHVLRCRVRYTLHDVGSGVEFMELTEDDRSAVQELVNNYGSTPVA